MAEDKAQHRAARPWARVGFWFGAVISIAANIASTAVHYGDPLSSGIAAWPPLALLLVIEIMTRPGKPITSGDEHSVPRAPAEVPVEAPVSPGHGPMPAPSVATIQAVVEEDPAALAFRLAQRELRKSSKCPTLLRRRT